MEDNPQVVNQAIAPAEPVQPVEQSKPKNYLSVFLMILLLISLSLTAFLYYQNQQLKNGLENYKDQFSPPNPTPTFISGQSFSGDSNSEKLNWEKFVSKKFGYSFEYPKEWEAHFYNEIEAIAGSHTITSYDTTEIEKYMDHGGLDIAKYGKAIAKIDISPSLFGLPGQYRNGDYVKDVKNQTEYVGAMLEAEQLSNSGASAYEIPKVNYNSNTMIGNLKPIEISYKNTFNFDSVTSYVIFPQNRVVYITVYFRSPNKEDLSVTELGKSVKEILSSFKFEDF